MPIRSLRPGRGLMARRAPRQPDRNPRFGNRIIVLPGPWAWLGPSTGLSAQVDDHAARISQPGGHGLVTSEEEDLALACHLLHEFEGPA